MKKLVSIVLASLLMASMSLAVSAETTFPAAMQGEVLMIEGAPRLAYDRETRTIPAGGSWTSYQYYCEAGDYFGGGCGAFSGKLTASFKYSSSVGGSRSTVKTKTFTAGGSTAFETTKTGYYNMVLTNNTSSPITVSCYVSVN